MFLIKPQAQTLLELPINVLELFLRDIIAESMLEVESKLEVINLGKLIVNAIFLNIMSGNVGTSKGLDIRSHVAFGVNERVFAVPIVH